MQARIYQTRKSAMQSGHGKAGKWVVELVGNTARTSDPLMGWTSADSTLGQVRLAFDTREKAIAYAKREGLSFTVETAKARKRLVKSYAENFSASRKQPWTH